MGKGETEFCIVHSIYNSGKAYLLLNLLSCINALLDNTSRSIYS